MTVESNMAPVEAEVARLDQEVDTASPEKLRDNVINTEVMALEVLQIAERQKGSGSVVFAGRDNDIQEPKTKAKNIRNVVQMVLLGAAKAVPKIAEAVVQDPSKKQEVNSITRSVLNELRGKIRAIDVTDASAPYFHKLFHTLFTGKVSTVEGLADTFKSLAGLKDISPGLHQRLGDSLMAVAHNKLPNRSDTDLRAMLGLIDENPNNGQPFSYLDRSGEATATERVENRLKLQNYISQMQQNMPDEYDRVLDFLRTGEDELENDPDKKLTREKAIDMLKNQGQFTEDQIKEFSDLLMKQTAMESKMSLRELTRQHAAYEDVANEIDKLTVSFISDKLFDENGNWRKEGEREIELLVTRAVGEIFRNITADPTQPFQEGFSDFIEGAVLRAVKNRIRNLSDNVDDVMAVYRRILEAKTKPGPNGEPPTLREVDMIDQLTRMRRNYSNFFRTLNTKINLERQYQMIAHESSNILKYSSPDQWTQVLQRTRFSELSVLMENDVLRTAVPYLLNYIQERIVRNGNELEKSLFSSEYDDPKAQGNKTDVKAYTSPTRSEFRSWFARLMKDLQQRKVIDREQAIQEWEIDRAYAFANAISNFLTMRAPGIMSNANVATHYAQIPFGELLGILNGQWRWDILRGKVGVADNPGLYGIEIQTDEEMAELAAGHIWERRKYLDPEETIDKSAKEFLHDVVETDKEIKARIMEDMAERTKKMWGYRLRKLAMGGALDRMGWRTNDGLEKLYAREAQAAENERGEKWGGWGSEDCIRWMERRVGVGGIFFLIDDIVAAQANAHLIYNLDGIPHDRQGGLGYSATEKIGEHSSGDSRMEEVMKVVLNGKQEDITYRKYVEIRKNNLRGEAFYKALKTDPVGFLNTLGQMLPELAEGAHEFTRADGVTRETVPMAEFMFNETRYPDTSISEADRQKRDKFKRNAYLYFGEENYKHLTFIMNFNQKLYSEKFYDTEGNEIKGKDAGREKFFQSIILARETAMGDENRQDKSLTPDDIITPTQFNDIRRRYVQAMDAMSGMTPEDRKTALEDYYDAQNKMRIRALAFEDSDALIPHLVNIVQDEKAYFGNGRENLGQENGFFQRCAIGYFEEKGSPLLPNFYMDLKTISEIPVNDDTLKGAVGDLKTLKDVQDKTFGLNGKLEELSGSGNYDEFKKSLLGYIGEIYNPLKEIDKAWAELHSEELLQVIAQFYQEVDGDEIFPIAQIQKLRKGQRVSMSKMVFGPNALSFSGDEIQDLYRDMMIAGYIRKDQYEKMSKALRVEFPRLLITSIIPNILVGLALYLLYTYTKEAYEEFGQKGD